MRREEAEELWGEFREVISALYHVPGLAAKMEAKLNKAFIGAAVSSRSDLKGWLDQFVKAGRLSLETMDREGGKVEFAAAWCGFLMLLPGECVPSEEFEAASPATKGRGKRSAASKAQTFPCAQGDSAARAKAGSASAKQAAPDESRLAQGAGHSPLSCGQTSSLLPATALLHAHNLAHANSSTRKPKAKAAAGEPKGRKKCTHGREQRYCRECGGARICQHNLRRNRCKECGGSSICLHGRDKHTCRECKGSAICEHLRHRSRCVDCGGSQICEHKKRRSRCRECGGKEVHKYDKIKATSRMRKSSDVCKHASAKQTCREWRPSEVSSYPLILCNG